MAIKKVVIKKSPAKKKPTKVAVVSVTRSIPRNPKIKKKSKSRPHPRVG